MVANGEKKRRERSESEVCARTYVRSDATALCLSR